MRREPTAPDTRRWGWASGSVATATAVVVVAGWAVAHPALAALVVVVVMTIAATGVAVAVRARRWLRGQGVWADTAVGWLLWNFLTGAPLAVGPALSDASNRRELVWSRARVAVPRLAVMAVYSGLVGWLAGVPALSAGGWPVTVWRSLVAGLVVPPMLGVAGWLAVKAAVERGHYRRWVLPLHLALHEVLGYPPDLPARRYLVVPRGKATEGHGVLVGLPATWRYEDARNETVFRLVCRKLALTDVTARWEGTSGYGYLQVRPTQHPPVVARFADPAVRVLVEAAKRSAPLIGIGAGDAPVAFDLDSEAPHLLLSAGTGGGKSSLIRAVACQLLHHGAVCWVIDLKRHSQQWLRGLPGVVYLRDPEDIHDAFIALAAEGQRRNRAFDDVPLGADGPTFPRLVVVCEELNATFSKLRRHWRTIRPTGAPLLSPAVEGFQDLLFMGRAVGINILAIAQQARAEDLGGGQARENFVVRILSRYSPQAWKMLAGDITYRPAPTTPGRVIVCRSGVATETQAVFFTDLEARDWATNGTPPPTGSVGASREPRGVSPQEINAALKPRGGEPANGVTLRQAAATGVVPVSHAALRWARQNDPEFPAPVGSRTVKGGRADLYDPDQLQRWHRNRPGTRGTQP